MPHKFKTPGSGQPLVIDAETRAELVRLRQEALEAMADKSVK
jgi:hypothetical protein